MRPDRKTPILVLGGGVTGLRLASTLAMSYSYPVTLVSQDIGGLISCYRHDGYMFDYGGHVYTNKDALVVALMLSLDSEEHIRKAFYLSRRAGMVPYPVQDHAHKLGWKLEGSPQSFESQTLEEYVLGTFGDQFYKAFFRPFTERVWTTHPSAMSCDWIANRVKLPTEGKEGWGLNDTFRYAPGDKISEYLLEEAVGTGVEVLSGLYISAVDTERKQVFLSDSSILEYEFLFSTLPIRVFLDLTDEALPHFVSNRVASVGIGFDSKLDYDFTWLYPDVKSSAHRATLLSRYHKDNAPDGKDSLLIEFPYRDGFRDVPPYLRAWRMSHGDYARWGALGHGEAAQALTDIRMRDVPGVKTATIGDAPGYPVPTYHARRYVAEIKEQLADKQIVTAGRWGSWGYFNTEHCLYDAEVAAGALIARVEAPDLYFREYLMSSFYYHVYEEMSTWPRLNQRRLRSVVFNAR